MPEIQWQGEDGGVRVCGGIGVGVGVDFGVRGRDRVGVEDQVIRQKNGRCKVRGECCRPMDSGAIRGYRVQDRIVQAQSQSLRRRVGSRGCDEDCAMGCACATKEWGMRSPKRSLDETRRDDRCEVIWRAFVVPMDETTTRRVGETRR
jgi:hypothetical protein